MRSSLDIDGVVRAVRSVLPPSEVRAALHEPRFTGNEWKYVKDCIDTNWVSSVGKYVDDFEKNLAAFTGARYAIAVVNGTAALHICLKLVGVRAGDEVLLPSMTFIASANAVSYCNATPHFVESSADTLGMDTGRLESYLERIAELRSGECFNRQTGSRIAAILPMHTFGHPVDLKPLLQVAARFCIPVIEDAAESLGSYYNERHTGNFGVLSALSFNGNKIITTGGGGAILTSDPDLARQAKHLTTTARIPHRWSFIHDDIGYNYRLPNINAALGCAQLETLDSLVANKRELAARYHRALGDTLGVTVFRESKLARSNYWLNVLLLDEHHVLERDALLQALNDNGLMARPVWTLMHQLPMFKECPRMPLPVAEMLSDRIINIPSSPFLASMPSIEMSPVFYSGSEQPSL